MYAGSTSAFANDVKLVTKYLVQRTMSNECGKSITRADMHACMSASRRFVKIVRIFHFCPRVVDHVLRKFF